jgi:hypothetical protein
VVLLSGCASGGNDPGGVIAAQPRDASTPSDGASVGHDAGGVGSSVDAADDTSGRAGADASAALDAAVGAAEGGGESGASGDSSAGTDSSAPADSSGEGDSATLADTTSPPVDSGAPDVTMEAAALDACGICDRVWICNGFADTWVSAGSQACADVRSGTTVATLYCAQGDTINYADPNNNDGTWATTPEGLALYYNSLQGTVEIDCTPGP